jgi:5-keto 4-deoxyuronate isomerase
VKIRIPLLPSREKMMCRRDVFQDKLWNIPGGRGLQEGKYTFSWAMSKEDYGFRKVFEVQ